FALGVGAPPLPGTAGDPGRAPRALVEKKPKGEEPVKPPVKNSASPPPPPPPPRAPGIPAGPGRATTPAPATPEPPGGGSLRSGGGGGGGGAARDTAMLRPRYTQQGLQPVGTRLRGSQPTATSADSGPRPWRHQQIQQQQAREPGPNAERRNKLNEFVPQ